MNIQEIRLLYDYNYWANGKIIAAARKVTRAQFIAPAEFPYGGLRGTMVHILETERGWRVRFENGGMAEELLESSFPSLSALEEHWKTDETAMRNYLAGLRDADLSGRVTYPIDGGKLRDRILWHCLIDVMNHGTQHRSEAAALLTRFGQSPGDLDLSVFLNETKV